MIPECNTRTSWMYPNHRVWDLFGVRFINHCQLETLGSQQVFDSGQSNKRMFFPRPHWLPMHSEKTLHKYIEKGLPLKKITIQWVMPGNVMFSCISVAVRPSWSRASVKASGKWVGCPMKQKLFGNPIYGDPSVNLDHPNLCFSCVDRNHKSSAHTCSEVIRQFRVTWQNRYVCVQFLR